MRPLSISLLSMLTVVVVMLHSVPVAKSQQNEYAPENQDKIIGLKHFEEFLRDLEKKIADWTRSFREIVVEKPDKNRRTRRQASLGASGSGALADPNQPPRRISDWIVVQDLIEGAKFVRKQVSDFIDRATRFITGDQPLMQQRQASGLSGAYTGPYVPIVKELREYMMLLQRRLNAWSVEVERIFRRGTTEAPMIIK